MSDQDILRKFFDAGQNWGERKLQPWSNTEEFNIALRDFGGLLACTNCSKILPVGEMYSVDACSEKCQAKLAAQQQPAPAPLPEWYDMLAAVFREWECFDEKLYAEGGCAAALQQAQYAAIRDARPQYIAGVDPGFPGSDQTVVAVLATPEYIQSVETLAGLVQALLKYSWIWDKAGPHTMRDELARLAGELERKRR